MRFLLIGIWFSALFGISGLQAQDRDIEQIIERQIQAFEADDFGAAFKFASPDIQRLFRNAQNFGAMVREGYPMVWRPGSVKFLGLRQESGRTMQTVLITDQTGAVHLLDYDMVQTENGWVINGVSLLGQPDASV